MPLAVPWSTREGTLIFCWSSNWCHIIISYHVISDQIVTSDQIITDHSNVSYIYIYQLHTIYLTYSLCCLSSLMFFDDFSCSGFADSATTRPDLFSCICMDSAAGGGSCDS